MRLQDMAGCRSSGALLVTAACSGPQTQAPPSPAAGPAAMDRTVLPIQEPARPAVTEIDARNVTAAAALRGEGAGGRAERRHRADRRHGLRRAEHLRRPGSHADARPAGPERASVQQLPHHRAVLADAGRAEVRPEPPHREHGVHHGNGHRDARLHRPDSEHDGAAGRDAAPERVFHRRVRQVARDGHVGSQHRRPVRPLAAAAGVRQVLRVLRRRDQPVGAAALRWHRPGRTAGRSELPLHDRHDRQGAGLDQVPEGADA